MSSWQRVDLPRESTGNVPVALQDQVTEVIAAPMHLTVNDAATLSGEATVDSCDLNFSAGHGISPGHSICLKEGTHFYFGVVLAVAVNTITMDSPLDYPFTTSAIVCIGNPNLNVDGSTIPKIAHLSPPPGVTWDITRIHVRLVDTQVMDAGTFAGRVALTNGLVLRRANESAKNISNVKSNGDLALVAEHYEFDSKPPAGQYGFTSVHVLAGQSNVGVALRLRGSSGERLEIHVQDDLTLIDVVQVMMFGHVVLD